MAITLAPATEQRIQRQLARGSFREPEELIAHALDLVEAEDDWLLRNKEAIKEALDHSFARVAREGTYSPEETQRMLAERRAARAA